MGGSCLRVSEYAPLSNFMHEACYKGKKPAYREKDGEEEERKATKG